MKKTTGIIGLAAALIISCNSGKKDSVNAEEAEIRQIDSLVTQMDSTRSGIDSAMRRVDMLIEEL